MDTPPIGPGFGIQPDVRTPQKKVRFPSEAELPAREALSEQVADRQVTRESLPAEHRTTRQPNLPEGAKAAHVGKNFFEPLLSAGRRFIAELQKVSQEFELLPLKTREKAAQGMGKVRKLVGKGAYRADLAVSNRSGESRLKTWEKEQHPALKQKKQNLEHQLTQLTHILEGMSTKDRRLKAGAIHQQMGALVKELSAVNEQIEAPREAFEKLKEARAAQAKLERKLSALEFKFDNILYHNFLHHPDYSKYQKIMAEAEEASRKHKPEAESLFEKAANNFNDVHTARQKLDAAQLHFDNLAEDLERAKKETQRAQEAFDQACPTPAQLKKMKAAESDKISGLMHEKIQESLELGAQIDGIVKAYPRLPVRRYLTVQTVELKAALQDKLKPDAWAVIEEFLNVEIELEQLQEKQMKLAA